MSILKKYPSGTTVRLSCTFQNDQNVNVDPQIVRLTLFNYKYEILEEISVSSKTDVGVFYFDYITPSKPQTIIYEWHGEIDGLPSIKRDKFVTEFI